MASYRAPATQQVKRVRFYSLLELGSLIQGTSTFESAETAGVTHAEIGTNTGVAGATMAVGETTRGLLHLPYDFDRGNTLYVSVIFSSSSTTAADDFHFLFLYEPLTFDTTGMVATVNNALDTVIPAMTKGSTTADTLQRNGKGEIDGGTLTQAVEYLHFDLEADVADTAVEVYGLELEYTPREMNLPYVLAEAVDRV